MSRRAWVLFASLCVVWGIPYLLIKVAVAELSPAALVFVRTGLAAVLLLPVALARGQVWPVLRRWRPLLVYSAVEIAVPWLLLSAAETRLSSSLSGLLIAAVPLVGAALAWSSGRDRIGRVGLTGLLLGFAGVAALVGIDVRGTQWPAVLAVAVVVVGYAVGPVIMVRQLSDLPALGVVATSLTLCAVAYAPFGLLTWPSTVPSGSVLVSVVLLATVCTAAAFLLLFALVAEIGPVRATVITYVNPAVAVAAGAVVLNERITAGTLIGFVLIILGSVLATRRPRAEAGRPPGVQAQPVAATEPG
jgi:drug/metabolite transporter (DMT)-like permease